MAIDIKRVRELKTEAPRRVITSGTLVRSGMGEGWYESWRFLMDLVSHETDEQFAKLEPYFRRYYKQFISWAKRLKRDPRKQETGEGLERLFRDRNFAHSLEQLLHGCDESRLFVGEDARKIRIGQMIRRLRITAGAYVGHD